MRIPPERTYTFSGERRQRVGPTGEYAANLLTMDYYRAGSRSREVTTRVETWMKRAGIGSQIRPEPIADRYYELRIKHPITGEQQNIADVGRGNSQVLPVLVGGYNLPKGSIYLVEEPEIHLHPRAQAELGDFLYDLYQNHVQVLVETHSEPLILRLQQHIACGNIPLQHVVFHYVYADPRSSTKTVKTMTTDPDGLFTDTWPEGFFNEPLEEAEKLTLIRFSKQARRS
jgi:predicted ATPase